MHRINDSVLENGSTLLCLGLSFHIICNLPLCKHDYQRLFLKQILLFILLSVHLFIQTVCLYAQVWIQYFLCLNSVMADCHVAAL